MSETEATEAYTVEQIRQAFAKWASPDDWGVLAFYEGSLIAALRGEYDELMARVTTQEPTDA